GGDGVGDRLAGGVLLYDGVVAALHVQDRDALVDLCGGGCGGDPHYRSHRELSGGEGGVDESGKGFAQRINFYYDKKLFEDGLAQFAEASCQFGDQYRWSGYWDGCGHADRLMGLGRADVRSLRPGL